MSGLARSVVIRVAQAKGPAFGHARSVVWEAGQRQRSRWESVDGPGPDRGEVRVRVAWRGSTPGHAEAQELSSSIGQPFVDRASPRLGVVTVGITRAVLWVMSHVTEGGKARGAALLRRGARTNSLFDGH